MSPHSTIKSGIFFNTILYFLLNSLLLLVNLGFSSCGGASSSCSYIYGTSITTFTSKIITNGQSLVTSTTWNYMDLQYLPNVNGSNIIKAHSSSSLEWTGTIKIKDILMWFLPLSVHHSVTSGTSTTRSQVPNVPGWTSVPQNDRKDTGFPPLLSDQDSDQNFSRSISMTESISLLQIFPFTKGGKNQVRHLSLELYSDTGFGCASTLGSRKCQTVAQKDKWFVFYIDSNFYLILTKDIYPHESNRVSTPCTQPLGLLCRARNHWVCFCDDGQSRAIFAAF